MNKQLTEDKTIGTLSGTQHYAFVQSDAVRDNDMNEKLYKKEQIEQCVKTRLLVANAFNKNSIYVNFRKQFITIKVSKVKEEQQCTEAARQLQMFCDKHGIEIVKTDAALLFRIKRAL